MTMDVQLCLHFTFFFIIKGFNNCVNNNTSHNLTVSDNKYFTFIYYSDKSATIPSEYL